jgi:hypothetical protein
MRQEDTRRLLIMTTGVLVLVLAVLTLALLLWPETLRALMFSAEPRSRAGERDGWGGLALSWFALIGSWLLLLVIAALLLPAARPAATASALFPHHSRPTDRRNQAPTPRDAQADDIETSMTR